eukprot:1382897-Amorphochlora_amoeboformis.AAC.1
MKEVNTRGASESESRDEKDEPEKGGAESSHKREAGDQAYLSLAFRADCILRSSGRGTWMLVTNRGCDLE